MVIELIIMVFVRSLICGFSVRKVTRDNTIKEMRENNGMLRDSGYERQQQPSRTTKEGWFDNDVEGAVYDSDGKRIR